MSNNNSCNKVGKPLVIIQTYEDRTNGHSQDSTDRLTQLINNSNGGNENKPNCFTDLTIHNKKDAAPPPPPLPMSGAANSGGAFNIVKPKQKAPPPPVPVKTSTLSSFSTFHQPPPCPTPDYDTLSLNSNSTLPRSLPKKPVNRTTSHNPSNTHHNDAVEMESLDSFAIHNPASNPKPPSTYFHPDSFDAAKKPLSNVTIGEYAGASRKTPGKFDFLNGSAADSNKEPINSQFASELAQTLNRSNLRRRTDSMENLLNHSTPQIRSDETGSVRITVNNNTNRQLNLDALSKVLTNRVKINVAPDMKKVDNMAAAPNGILKNAQNGSATGNGNMHHRSLVHQKSITFGEM